MQKPKSLLETNKNNYVPDKAERGYVHYKAEKIKFSPTTGERLSKPQLYKTGVKLFASVKPELEKLGYSIEILFHPNGLYNTPINVPETPGGANGTSEMAVELAEAKKENAELRARLSELEERCVELIAKLDKGAEKPKSNLEKAREAKAAKDAARKQEQE